MREIFRKLVTFQEAKDLVWKYFKPLGLYETVPVAESAGRIAADDVFSPMNLPPFNRSTVDGFAVRWEDVSGSDRSPLNLKIVGESLIGEKPKPLSGARSCMRISTGAIIPKFANSVIMVENVKDNGDFITVNSEIREGENIALAGSDTYRDALVISRGSLIMPNEVALLSSLGIEKIRVAKKLIISVISTGNELIEPGAEYVHGKIYDGNSSMIISSLNRFSFIKVSFLGIVSDNPDEIRERILSASKRSQVVIISGGSSAGEADFVHRIMGEFDPGLIFHGVLAKPGKPAALAMIDGKPVIGLPGFPVSAALMLWSVFLPGIMKMAGLTGEIHGNESHIKVKTKLDLGLQNIIPVISDNMDSGLYPVTGLSGSISRLIGTSGFISVKGRSKYLDPEERVSYFPWVLIPYNHGTRVLGTIDSHNVDAIRKIIPDAVMIHSDPQTAISLFLAGGISAIVLRYQEPPGLKEFLKAKSAPDSSVFRISTKFISFRMNGKSVSSDSIEELKKADSISTPPLKYLESVLNKGETLRDLVEMLTRRSSLFTSDENAEFQISVMESKSNNPSHKEYLFHEAVVLRNIPNLRNVENDYPSS